MTAFDYAELATTATELLTEFGASAFIKRDVAGTYDPATGSAPVVTTMLATIACVFAYPASYVDGTLILQGDQRAYLAPAVVPKQGDRFTWQGADFQVVNVKALSPAGLPLLWDCQIRG